MSGALAGRVFAEKLSKVGFVEIDVVERRPFGVDDCELAPLFTDELIALMRSLIPPERQDCVATSIVVRARKPA